MVSSSGSSLRWASMKACFVGGNVLLDGDRLIARRGAITPQRGAQLLQIQVQTRAISGRSASTLRFCSRTRKQETEG